MPMICAAISRFGSERRLVMNGDERSVFERITLSLREMRPSERKVADYVIAEPDKALSFGISALAAASDVSDPTVLRFLSGDRFSGLSGFQAGFGALRGARGFVDPPRYRRG